MNVIFTDTMGLTPLELKRLLMVGRRISFVEQVSFDVEHHTIKIMAPRSPLQQIIKELNTDFLEIRYLTASQGSMAAGVFTPLAEAYEQADINNKTFIKILLNGIGKREIIRMYSRFRPAGIRWRTGSLITRKK